MANNRRGRGLTRTALQHPSPPNTALQRTRAAASLHSVPGKFSAPGCRRAPLSFQAFGDRSHISLALAVALLTALPALAGQPTPIQPKTTQPVWLARPLPDPTEVRRDCPNRAVAPPIVEAELRADAV